MQTAVRQSIGTQYINYPKIEKREAKKTPKYYTEDLVDREETLQSIAFLTQYMEDLRAGRPVENMSPSNDPWFLIPENIAIMIESDRDLLEPGVKFREIDPDNIWACIK